MLIEFAMLAFVRRKSGSGLRVFELFTSLGAGAALILALGAALRGSSWQHVASWLVLALVAHVADLTIRWTHEGA